MVGAGSTEPKPKTDAVEIPSDQTGCTGSNLFLLSRFPSEFFGARDPATTPPPSETAGHGQPGHRGCRSRRPGRRGGPRKSRGEGAEAHGFRGPGTCGHPSGACHAKLYNPEPRGRAVRWRCGLPKFPKPRHLLNSRAHITRSLSLASRDSIAVGVRLVVPGVRAGAAGGRRIEPTKLCRSSWPWRSRRTSWR